MIGIPSTPVVGAAHVPPPTAAGLEAWGVRSPTGMPLPSHDEFLLADLRDMVTSQRVASFLPPELSHSVGVNTAATVDVSSWGVLQLMDAVNVAAPRAQRVQPFAVAVPSLTETSENGEGPEDAAASCRRRIAKLMMTDGLHSVVLLELSPCAPLDHDDVVIGSKWRLRGEKLRVRHGAILLDGKAATLEILGGCVEPLHRLWEDNRRMQAARISGSLAAVRTVLSSATTAVAAATQPPTQFQTLSGTMIDRITPTPSAAPPLAAGSAAEVVRTIANGDSSAVVSVPVLSASPLQTPDANASAIGVLVDADLSEVRSDLSITARHEFSLMIRLCIRAVLRPESPVWFCPGDAIDVDMGHEWLQRLLGMSCDDFIRLTDEAAFGRSSSEQALGHVIAHVGSVLEQYGRGTFTLLNMSDAASPLWTVTREEKVSVSRR